MRSSESSAVELHKIEHIAFCLMQGILYYTKQWITALGEAFNKVLCFHWLLHCGRCLIRREWWAVSTAHMQCWSHLHTCTCVHSTQCANSGVDTVQCACTVVDTHAYLHYAAHRVALCQHQCTPIRRPVAQKIGAEYSLVSSLMPTTDSRLFSKLFFFFSLSHW